MMEAFKISLKALLWSVLAHSMTVFAVNGDEPQQQARTPAPVEDLVYVKPFVLSQGYRWSPVFDETETDTGFIVVLRVNPELVVPRDGPTPMLYAGDGMLQALNFGHTSGYVIGLIPGDVDLSNTLIWFGPPTAPDRVNQQSIQDQHTLAEKAGIHPFSPGKIKTVTKPAIATSNFRALLRGELAELVLKYAPQESSLARKWRLPEAKRSPDPSPPAAAMRQQLPAKRAEQSLRQ